MDTDITKQHDMNISLFQMIITDGKLIIGTSCAFLVASTTWIVEYISPIVGFISVCLGTIVLILTIWQKIVDLKKSYGRSPRNRKNYF